MNSVSLRVSVTSIMIGRANMSMLTDMNIPETLALFAFNALKWSHIWQ